MPGGEMDDDDIIDRLTRIFKDMPLYTVYSKPRVSRHPQPGPRGGSLFAPGRQGARTRVQLGLRHRPQPRFRLQPSLRVLLEPRIRVRLRVGP
jgi:hypothetical protein